MSEDGNNTTGPGPHPQGQDPKEHPALKERSRELGNDFVIQVQRCAKRIFADSFERDNLTEGERTKLIGAGVDSPLVQKLAGWRKALLWGSGIMLLISFLITLLTYQDFEEQYREALRTGLEAAREQQRANTQGGGQTELVERQLREAEQRSAQMDQEIQFARNLGNEFYAQQLEYQKAMLDQQVAQLRSALGQDVDEAQIKQLIDVQVNTFGKENMETIDGIQILLFLVQAVGIVLIILAARSWHNLLRSRNLSRIAWLVLLLFPMVLGLIPARMLMDFSQIQNPEMEKQMMMVMGLAFGLTYLTILGPRVIAIFPGAIRSAMELKVLVPQSPAAGWLVAICAPVYALIMFIVTIVLNQVGANLGMMLGMLAICAAPLVYIVRAKDVLRPHDTAELGPLVQRARLFSAIFNTVGIILVGTNILEMEQLQLKAHTVISFVVGVLGSMWLLTVVAADLIIALFRLEYNQSKSFHDSNLEQDLAENLNVLDRAGLTSLIGKSGAKPDQPTGGQTGPPNPPPPLPPPPPQE